MKIALLRCIKHYRLWPYALEGVACLIYAKLIIHTTPAHAIQKSFGATQCETLYHAPSHQIEAIKTIARVVPALKRILPWQIKCLDEAIAAQCMLKFRQINHTLYLGMNKNAQHQFIAHAWLRAGDLWVVGYSTQLAHTIVASFAQTYPARVPLKG